MKLYTWDFLEKTQGKAIFEGRRDSLPIPISTPAASSLTIRGVDLDASRDLSLCVEIAAGTDEDSTDDLSERPIQRFCPVILRSIPYSVNCQS